MKMPSALAAALFVLAAVAAPPSTALADAGFVSLTIY
jgi:hypothetical protein